MAKHGYPEPTVGALIFNHSGQILLIRGKKFKNRYVIPGGHIEIGETMEEALRREVREETGLKINKIKIIGLQEAIFPEHHINSRHFIYIDFLCQAEPGEVVLNHESEEFIWINPEEALEIPLETYTKGLIREYLKGEESAFRRSIFYKIGK